MTQPIVFVSYSHKDKLEKEKLVSHLSVLDPALISVWSDDALQAGEEYENAIIAAIGQAKVAILLITANFLNSKFIREKEIKLLLDRSKNDGLHVFPVIANHCAWRKVDWLKKMNVRPEDGRPIWDDGGAHVDKDLTLIAEELADIIEREKEQAPPSVPESETVEPEPSVKRKGTKSTSSGATKILIVDDEVKYRRSVVSGLAAMKISIDEAASVKEAIELLKADRDIRIILLDIRFKGGESGRDLLEFIKPQSSYYRVIIMTGYSSQFAAEEASSYHVFGYFEKSGGAVPMQTLRFAVSNAIYDLKQHHEHEAEDAIEKRFPTPFIYIYQHLSSHMSPLEKLMSQKDMLELLLHFSFLILLSEYLHSGVHDEDLDKEIRENIERPTLGDWFRLINVIASKKGYAKETFFLDAFLEFFTKQNRKILGDFIEVRNKYLGHGTKHSDYEYGQLVDQCNKWIIALLHDYRFITRFLLCYVWSVQIIKGNYLYSLNECVTANPQLLRTTRSLNLMLDTLEMHLVNTEADPLRGLSLSPFIILENCPECRQTEIFFYSKLHKGQLHYVSYKTGHWLAHDGLTPDFIALTRLEEGT